MKNYILLFIMVLSCSPNKPAERPLEGKWNRTILLEKYHVPTNGSSTGLNDTLYDTTELLFGWFTVTIKFKEKYKTESIYNFDTIFTYNFYVSNDTLTLSKDSLGSLFNYSIEGKTLTLKYILGFTINYGGLDIGSAASGLNFTKD